MVRLYGIEHKNAMSRRLVRIRSSWFVPRGSAEHA